METKEIEDRIETIELRMSEADEGKHPLGNLVIAIGLLLDINRGLLARIETLEQSATPELPAECAAQECTYHCHYLVYHDPAVNGPRLEHAAFHHAEKRCEEGQNAAIKWLEDHLDDPKAIEPPHLQ